MDAEALIGLLFVDDNKVTYQAFAEKRPRWVETLRQQADRTRVTFVPFFSIGGPSIWYAIGPPHMPPGELLELCRGFVGPSYAEHIQLIDRAQPASEPGQALMAYVETHLGDVVEVNLGVISADRRGDAEHAAAAFERLEQLVESRPPWSGYSTRSLAQVLADLDLALAEQDLSGAEDLLTEIERSHSISEVNLHFLRIRMLQAVGRGAEILEHPQLGYLVNARRPRKVTRALLEAAYDVYLHGVPLETAQLAASGSEILDALGPAATELVEPGTEKEAIALLAAGLAFGRGQAELEHVLDWLKRNSTRGDLSGVLPTPTTKKPAGGKKPREQARDELGEIAALIVEGRPVEALVLLKLQKPSVRVTRLAFQVDVLLRNLESAELLLEFGLDVFDRLDEVGDARIVQRLDELTAVFPQSQIAAEQGGVDLGGAPSSWNDWLEGLQSGVRVRTMLGLVDLGAASWTADSSSARSIADAIVGLRSEQAAAVRSVAGTIVEAHSEIDDLEASLALRASIMELIAVSGLPTTQELRSIVGWAEAIMRASVDTETVNRMLDALEVFASEHATPALAEALADLAAIVAHHGSAGDRGRTFVVQVVSAIRAAGAAADLSVRSTAARAAADVGAPVHAEDEFWQGSLQKQDWMELLDGLDIGIHTLIESVASRARAVLEPFIGSGSVTTNADFVATESLRNIASGSHVMVLVTAAAKHSASAEIERVCAATRLVRVSSRGLSGLLRELERHIRSQYQPATKAA